MKNKVSKWEFVIAEFCFKLLAFYNDLEVENLAFFLEMHRIKYQLLSLVLEDCK